MSSLVCGFLVLSSPKSEHSKLLVFHVEIFCTRAECFSGLVEREQLVYWNPKKIYEKRLKHQRVAELLIYSL